MGFVILEIFGEWKQTGSFTFLVTNLYVKAPVLVIGAQYCLNHQSFFLDCCNSVQHEQ